MARVLLDGQWVTLTLEHNSTRCIVYQYHRGELEYSVHCHRLGENFRCTGADAQEVREALLAIASGRLSVDAFDDRQEALLRELMEQKQ